MLSQPRCTENTGHTEVIGSGRHKLKSRFVSLHVVSAYQGSPVVKPSSRGREAKCVRNTRLRRGLIRERPSATLVLHHVLEVTKMNASKNFLLCFCAAAALSTTSTWAEKPEWAGKSGGGKPEKRKEVVQQSRPKTTAPQVSVQISIGSYFVDSQRAVVRDYYQPGIQSGSCPPGLAKKNNGCMPPGLAKKWRVGRPLPADVTYYSIPNSVSIQLGVPPSGHKFVRVAADILLIAVGTGMVVDAIEDLGRL